MGPRGSRPAVSSATRLALLDRDGTLIEHIPYLSDATRVRLLPGVPEGLKALRQMGYALVLVTNQSGLGRGYFKPDQLQAVHDAMEAQLAEQGVQLDQLCFCPHHPSEGCQCRKPGLGMAQQAGENLKISLLEGLVVGDAACDIGLAKNLGWRAFLLPDSSPNASGTWQEFPEYDPGYQRISNFSEVITRLRQ